MLASSQQGLKHVLISRPQTKFLAPDGKVQVRRGGSHDCGNSEIVTQIGKPNDFPREIYRTVATRELLNTAKLSFFKSVFVAILSYVHECGVINEHVLSQV